MRIETLKRRSEFQRVRGGARCARRSLVLEARAREGADPGPARFGFTITRKIGTAGARNRVRGRPKAALATAAPEAGVAGCDYVVVARDGIVGLAFPELAGELGAALAHVKQGLAHPRRQDLRGSRRPKSPA